jgi:hypothetical protein
MGMFRRKLSLYLAIPVILGTACLSCLISPEALDAAAPESRMTAHMDAGSSCLDEDKEGEGHGHGSDCRVSAVEGYHEAKKADFDALDSGAMPEPVFSEFQGTVHAWAAPDSYWPKIDKNRLITGCVVKNE